MKVGMRDELVKERRGGGDGRVEKTKVQKAGGQRRRRRRRTMDCLLNQC